MPAIVLATVLTALAVLAITGRRRDASAGVARLVVVTLPIGIASAGYAAGVGLTLVWAIVASVASAAGIVLAAWIPQADPQGPDRVQVTGITGLVAGGGALIFLGLGAVSVLWASSLIAAFSELSQLTVGAILILAGLAVALGRGATTALSRAVVALAIVGAASVLAVGILLGDVGGLTAPEVPVDPVPTVPAILYALAVIVIGAAHPGLGPRGVSSRKNLVIAGIITGAILVLGLVGLLVLYGGSLVLPSILVNLLAVGSPQWLGLIVCAGAGVVGAVLAGSAIRGALEGVAAVVQTDPDDRPRIQWAGVAVAVVLFGVVSLAPRTSWIVVILGLIGVASLAVRWRLGRTEEAVEGDQAVGRNEVLEPMS